MAAGDDGGRADDWHVVHLPYGPNGWQLCMAFFGLAYGARLVWPGWTGAGQSHATMLAIGAMPAIIGLLVIGHALFSIATLLINGYWDFLRSMAASLGAVLWTTIGLVATIGELADGYVPSLGLFELLGGVGLAVALVQRARREIM